MVDDEELRKLEAKRTDLLQRRRRADADLRRLKADVAAANYKKASQLKFLVGHAVIAWAEADEKFRSAIASGIGRFITRDADRAALTGTVFDVGGHV